MRLRRVAVSLLATGLLVGLAGCGDGATDVATDDTGGETTTGTGEPTSDAPPVLTKETFAQDITAAQVKAGSAHFEATIDVAGQSFDMSGDVAGLGDPEAMVMDVTASIQGEQLQFLRVDKVLYLKGEQIAPAGKEWVKIDLSDPNAPLAKIFDAADPSNFTAYLEGIIDFEDKGLETVDGVETRHYTVTSDTAKMLESNPMFAGQDASTLGLPAELNVEVYVDRENRPVQIQVDLGDVGSFDGHFSDYGKDVSVKAPDPSTVGEFSL